MPPLDLPTFAQIAHTYTELVRRQVTAKAADLWPMGHSPPGFVGAYQDDARTLCALWVCELPLAASLGAVLTLMPPAAAIEAGRAQALSEDLRDNCREIANITANSFQHRRVRLIDFLPPAATLPPPMATFLASATRRIDLRLTVAGYPGGRLTMLAG